MGHTDNSSTVSSNFPKAAWCRMEGMPTIRLRLMLSNGIPIRRDNSPGTLLYWFRYFQIWQTCLLNYTQYGLKRIKWLTFTAFMKQGCNNLKGQKTQTSLLFGPDKGKDKLQPYHFFLEKTLGAWAPSFTKPVKKGHILGREAISPIENCSQINHWKKT